MKKKFGLILALALVGSMVFAGFNFGGEALVGYKFDLTNLGKPTTYGYDSTAGYFYMNATTDFAKVSLRGVVSGADSSYNYEQVATQLSLYLDKAFMDKGIELPVGLTAYVGDADGSGYYSYVDPDGIVDDNYDGFDSNTRSEYPIGLDVSYEGYKARTFFTITSGTTFDPLFSVKGPIVDGVDFAASFLGAAKYLGGDSEINLSATADVAKLADLDFNLKASVFTLFGINATSDPIVLAAVTGGKDALTVSAEYSLNATADNTSSVAGSRIFAGASYALEDVTVGGGADYTVSSSLFGYNVWAKTTLGGATYKAKIAGNSDGALALTTQVYLAF